MDRARALVADRPEVDPARLALDRSSARQEAHAARQAMSGNSGYVPGLEGVVAFETQIAEPDKAGGSLRYRGVDIEELVGHVSFGHVWGLLVDSAFAPGLPAAEAADLPVSTGDVRADAQSGIAALGARWGLRPLLDISAEQAREDVGRSCAQLLALIAASARGTELPRPRRWLCRRAWFTTLGIPTPTHRGSWLCPVWIRSPPCSI